MQKRRLVIACTLVACFTLWVLGAASSTSAETRTVRVGVYENEPKVYTDEDGQPAGIFIDLIEAIAEQEGWSLEYVPGTWADGLSALSAGRIDLMPDVAYTAERDELYDFHEQPVVESWSYVYAAPGSRVERITQLDGLRVAVLEGSVQQTIFEQMVAGFELNVTIVPAESLEDAFDLAASGEADAAIANYLFGDYSYETYGFEKTPIVFNAIPLHFAVADGRNADLLQAIDSHLSEWTAEPGSVYYRTLRHYTVADDGPSVAKYMFWVLGGAVALLLLAVVAILLLRWQVRARTRHLLEAQSELEASRAHLEELVGERTAQLARANENLAVANNSKSDFLTLMSHELRSQLRSVIGLSGMMLSEPAKKIDDEQRRKLELINEAGVQLLRLTTNVLSQARMDAGGMEVVRVPFDAGALVREVADTMSVQAEERGLSLTAEVPDGEVMIVSDERIVRQILLNLVDNALKFTDKGFVTLSLSDRGHELALSVRDTGCGIDPGDIKDLFTEYWQGTHAIRGDDRGAGLGLPLAARMATMIDAHIDVMTIPGRGSTFTLAIPAVSTPSTQ